MNRAKVVGALLLLLLLIVAAVAVNQFRVAGDATITAEDEAAIYSAVVRRIYEQDDTFGGQLQPETLYIVSQSVAGADEPASGPQEHAPLSATVQQQIEGALVDLPARIIWIGHREDASHDEHGTIVNGAVVTLGTIEPQNGQRVHVAGSIYVANLAAGGRTYVVEKVEGRWEITGTTGSEWIS